MVTNEDLAKQLERVGFKMDGWGKAEVHELPHILVPGEEIYELVNGVYEGGFALLMASNVRLLLIDKKPLNYLTVEDFRFDMINEIDYSHRLMGAQIRVSTGSKTLRFRSYNQKRLRKLISHVQHCMAENKQKESSHAEDQKLHLEQINQQLQAYLIAQHQQQEQLQQELKKVQEATAKGEKPEVHVPEPVKPAPELSDYLLARSLLWNHADNDNGGSAQPPDQAEPAKLAEPEQKQLPQQSAVAHKEETAELSAGRVNTSAPPQASQMEELYAAGMEEVFGGHPSATMPQPAEPPRQPRIIWFDVNPIAIAYAKLPLALRNKKFGRPSFHAHSKAEQSTRRPQPAA